MQKEFESVYGYLAEFNNYSIEKISKKENLSSLETIREMAYRVNRELDYPYIKKGISKLEKAIKIIINIKF
jgi:hypothetical protein